MLWILIWNFLASFIRKKNQIQIYNNVWNRGTIHLFFLKLFFFVRMKYKIAIFCTQKISLKSEELLYFCIKKNNLNFQILHQMKVEKHCSRTLKNVFVNSKCLSAYCFGYLLKFFFHFLINLQTYFFHFLINLQTYFSNLNNFFMNQKIYAYSRIRKNLETKKDMLITSFRKNIVNKQKYIPVCAPGLRSLSV